MPQLPAPPNKGDSAGAGDEQPAPTPLSDLLGRKQAEVVLRHLESDIELSGRYVKVIDQLTPGLHERRSFNFLSAPLKSSSEFDRQMAYYHIDLIQRHFRDLGLHVLDDYPELNPLQVVLNDTHGPLYTPSEKRLYISALIERFTNAQDARILYHEFVHAVTDALARLNRHDKTDPLEPRRFQVLQAAAIDEGMADFFACSLAARHGAGNAFFYPPPMVDDTEDLTWIGIRRLGGPAPQYAALAHDFSTVKADGLPVADDDVSATIYMWAEQWGRYLWSLRCALGADVAEMIIAHSIFFLTRWSTFSAGVLAIALADRLLFGGSHQTVILDVELAHDWQDEIPALDDALQPASYETDQMSSGALPRSSAR